MTNLIDFRYVESDGARLRVAVTGTGPLVLFVHGFPESWYSWRHQMKPVSDAGFTAAAVDMLGYGGSDNPKEIERYSMENLTRHMANVARTLSPDQPSIIVGHDWGAPIAWNSALVFPDVFRAVGGLSVPYSPPGAVMFLDVIDKVFTQRGKFFYQVYFQPPGLAEAELEKDPRDTIRRFYYAISGDAPDGTWPVDKKHGDSLLHRLPDPDPFPAWLTEADLDYYESEFRSSGFHGPLNRYRNHQRDYDFLSALPDKAIYQPSLFIGGERDLVLKMLPGVDPIAAMRPNLPGLRTAQILPGCGHWTQQEKPEEVNALLISWLKGL